MHKVAVLLDGGYVLFELSEGRIKTDPSVLPSVEEVERLAHNCYDPEREDLFRIYYYDCRPFGGEPYHP